MDDSSVKIAIRIAGPMKRSTFPAEAPDPVDQAINDLLHILQMSPPRDPCTVFYTARHLTAVGDAANAEIWVGRALERGFNCFAWLTRDPWLESLRSRPQFQALLTLAKERRAAALQVFTDAGGEQVLGVGTGQ